MNGLSETDRLRLAVHNLETALILAEREAEDWKRRALEGIKPEHMEDAVAIIAWKALCQMVRESAWITIASHDAVFGQSGRSWVFALRENHGRQRIAESVTPEEAVAGLVKDRRENP